MSTAMVSLENAPRDVQGLMNLKRGIRFRLAHQLGLFSDESQESAFMQAPDEQMCQALLGALQQFDSLRPAGAPPAQPQMGAQIQLPPMHMPQGMPAVVPPQMQQQMQYPSPQMPQQPTQSGFQMPGMPLPGVAMPQPGGFQMPAVVPPQQYQQPPPQAPPQQQMVVRAPSTAKAAPQGIQMPPQVPSAPPAVGQQQVLQIQTQIAESLKKLAETSEKTQRWLEEQQTGQAQLLTTILAVQLAMAEQAGIDANTLAKCIKAMTPNTVAAFLEALGSAEGKQ